MSTLRIFTREDESVQYSIDGNNIIEVDHDTDGFQFMEKMDSAMRSVAEHFGLDIEETDAGSADDEDELDEM